MIIYVDKNGKEIKRVEGSTYTYVDKNGKEIKRVGGSTYTYVDNSGKVIKVEASKASKNSVEKTAKPKKVVLLKKETKNKK